jgi:hypothetical protein
MKILWRAWVSRSSWVWYAQSDPVSIPAPRFAVDFVHHSFDTPDVKRTQRRQSPGVASLMFPTTRWRRRSTGPARRRKRVVARA